MGTTYYAYTTGTRWGNVIGVLRSDQPTTGWVPATRTRGGSSALPSPPAWQAPATQNAPGVVHWRGKYLMYYDAVDQRAPYAGVHCLALASAAAPAGPFEDTSSAPLFCDPDGSIDPDPVVAAHGTLWLAWKSNDGSSTQPAQLWSAPLDRMGTALAGPPRVLLTQDNASYPWETTIEAPDLATVAGTTYLFFSSGLWESPTYAEHVALCPSVAGPCTIADPTPVLASDGQVSGPGSASVFLDAAGRWWMAYDGWQPGCTSYACGHARDLYVARVRFPPRASCPSAAACAVAVEHPSEPLVLTG